MLWMPLSLSGCGSLIRWLCDIPDAVATLPFAEGEFVVDADACWEYSRPVYYTVRQGGAVTVPRTFLTADGGEDAHSGLVAVSAQGGALVGLAEGETLHALYHVESQESWPRLRDDERIQDAAVQQKWAPRFDAFAQEHPHLHRE